MMYGYPGYGSGAGAWMGIGLMMFFGLIVLVGIVLLVVWIVRSGSHGPMMMHQSGTSAACDVAKQRYARGEITKEQFDEICRTVGG